MTTVPLQRSSTAELTAPPSPRVDGRPITPGSRPTAVSALPASIQVAGKFFACGGRTFFVRGVSYGPFAAEPDGSEYHGPESVDEDFRRIAAHGFNTVRTYTPPPRWLLDLAQRHDLRVVIGLPWEQHVTFLDTRARARSIAAGVRRGVAASAGHPAVLAYTVGNEIPPAIVRWHGPRRIERFLQGLYEEAKSEHPEALITYVNFPTTEYLELPFLDFFSWNVYLEQPESLARYLARLQNLAGEKPLLLTEIGLDSLRHGEQGQAQALDWQIRTAGAAGCAGAVVFSWTDEWNRGGHEVLDWRFGLTDLDRLPKPALRSAAAAATDFPLAESSIEWPLVSVVVCSYNGARTLRQTLDAISRLSYPRYETIVVDDGSTDATPAIARDFAVRLFSTENRGLSHARNLGLRQARGEIVAYIDDDAYPEPMWLRYLAHTFATTDHAGVGGPNMSPPDDGEVAGCVSHGPGGPNHVLLSDTVAEHIPGCNMAFRRQALLDAGGFDERFRIAGDDVDVCWTLQERGHTLGFNPAAMVWHHCRSTVGAYLRQQRNYGRAEAMLEAKWPSKYNSAGYPRWSGRVYGRGQREALGHSRAVDHGVWGTNLFQTLYVRPPGPLRSLTLLPEWYLLISLLALMSLGGLAWRPLMWTALPALIGALGTLVLQAASAALRAPLPFARGASIRRCRERARITLLHLIQPLARLRGRLSYGLHPLRRRDAGVGFVLPRPRRTTEWSEQPRPVEQRLGDLEHRLNRLGARVRRGGAHDRWDLEIRGGLFGAIRLLMAVEEHGWGRQLARVRSWPALTSTARQLLAFFAVVACLLFVVDLPFAGAAAVMACALVGGRAFFDCAAASSVFSAERRRAVEAGRITT